MNIGDSEVFDLHLNEIKKKTLILIFISFLSAFFYWKLVKANLIGNEIQHGLGFPMMIFPFLLYFFYKLTEKKKHLAIWTGHLMAICLGVILGGLSGIFEQSTEGLVIQAVMITFSSAVSIIYLYKNKIIIVDDKFLQFTALVGITLSFSFVIDFVMSFVDLNWHSLYKGSSLTAIVLNGVILLLGYLVYIVDLNIIDTKLKEGSVSKDQTWSFAIELLVDVAWIYLAVIFLLLRTRGRKK